MTIMYTCSAPECNVSHADRGKFRACGQCQWALYCGKEHQVLHWKACHKYECYKAQEDADPMYVSLCNNHTHNQESPQAIWQQFTSALPQAAPGVAVYLGRNKVIAQPGHPHDKEDEESLFNFTDKKDMDKKRTALLNLYLPRVPQALLRKAQETNTSHETRALVQGGSMVQGGSTVHDICAKYCSLRMRGLPNVVLKEFGQSIHLKHTVKRLFEVAVADNYSSKEEKMRKVVPCLLAIQQFVAHLDWTRTDPDLSLTCLPEEEQKWGNLLLGEVLQLEGGIEMIYITPVVLFFPILSKEEMDWFNGANSLDKFVNFPILQSPVVAYRCVAEDWCVLRVWDRCHVHFCLSTYGTFTAYENDAHFLKIFIAAAEFGDVTALYSCWNAAKKFAIMERLEEIFCKAALKLLELLPRPHPHPSREECYFAHEIASMYQSLATWQMGTDDHGVTDNEALWLAAKFYHQSALKTHEFYPNRCFRICGYSDLGVTLLRLNQVELAKRSFLWALTDSIPWKRQLERDALATNLDRLWNYQHKTLADSEQMQQWIKQDLKDNRKSLKEQSRQKDRFYSSECTHCQKDLEVTQESDSFCQHCKARYCTRKCQKRDWKEHKKVCTPRSMTVDKDDFWVVGSCTGFAGPVLSQIKDQVTTSSAVSISLAEMNQEMESWANNISREMKLPPFPGWLQEELDELIVKLGLSELEI